MEELIEVDCEHCGLDPHNCKCQENEDEDRAWREFLINTNRPAIRAETVIRRTP